MRIVRVAVLAVCCSLLAQAQAFQLSPIGTQAERKFAKRWGTTIKMEIALGESALHNFSDPVHETLTQKIFNCDGDWDECSDPDLEYAGPYIIAGVRWNDDPVFMLTPGEASKLPCRTQDTVSFVTQTKCWLGLFRDAEKKTVINPSYFKKPGTGSYLTRSHFGDLQFLHAMASEDGETAEATKARIMMWAEFAWGVIEGKYRLDTPLRTIPIAGWSNHFTNGHTVQDLFTMGRPWLRPHVKSVAFGSLLHLVQDSFAAGHVDRREPISGQYCLNGSQQQFGRISEFHSYGRQDHSKHKEADSNESARKYVHLNDPDVLDAGKQLRQFFDQQGPAAPWSSVEPYLSQCIFALEDGAHTSSAGDQFSTSKD